MLDERPERRRTRSKTGHDDRLGVERGQLHHTGLDGDGNLGTDGETGEVSGTLTVPRSPARGGPVDGDDQEFDQVTDGGVGRGDGIVSRLDLGNQTYDLNCLKTSANVTVSTSLIFLNRATPSGAAMKRKVLSSFLFLARAASDA
jgi:hypothetical protein